MLNKFFRLDSLNTTVRKEVIAGITTFLTMAYIIFVNPDILSKAGMPKGALITATILASFLGTVLVGLWANVPFAMAPGMGLNAFFAFTLVLGQKISWQTALGVVFVSGIIFLILTLAGVREKIVNAIPLSLRLAVGAGIGLFITFIGFKGMGIVTDNPATLVSLGKFSPAVVLSLIGLVIIAVLEVKKIKGSILIGIIATTVLAIIYQSSVNIPKPLVSLPSQILSTPPSIAPIALKLDIFGALQWGLFGSIFSFMFVDLFDSVGTIVACSNEAGMVQEDGSIKNIGKTLEADAIATVAGSLLGTSTTTTYVESASGIAEGGRSGLTSVVISILFLLALFFTPLIGIVPGFATAPALVIVGVFMFRNIKDINFKDFTIAIPAFITIILMPLTYSISNGLAFGFISYLIINVAAGKFKKISLVMWIIGALSVLDLIFYNF